MSVPSTDSSSVRQVTLPVAVAIVVANMIGTGVFGSLGFQVMDLPSGFPVMLLWILGGVLSFCGAVCYAELAAMMPRSGGEYHLLREAWHPAVGFLAGWISATVGFAAPVALNAVLLGEYLSAIFSVPGMVFSMPVVLIVTLIHLGSLNWIGKFQVFFTSLKIGLIVVLAVSAFLLGTRQPISFLPESGDFDLIAKPAFAVSLVYVLYAYAGWNAAAYITGELRNPQRTLPLALLLGTGLVTVLYVMLNAAFLYATPIDAMAGQPEVGFVAAKSIFGDRGGAVMGLLISIGLISTISSMTWAGPRVTAMMGEDFRQFHWLGRRNRFGIPVWAVLAQTVVVLLLVATATFEQLMQYVQALLTLSSLLTVLAVFWLRWKKPEADRPYRAWGYPVTPALFSLMSIYVLFFQVKEKPVETGWGLVTLLVGFAIYAMCRRGKKNAGGVTQG
ncbi:MAG: amino acid permease [Verrucomicrobiae bacterium]|nr:amino acid permease [Verrucomicrobiae bacterium]